MAFATLTVASRRRGAHALISINLSVPQRPRVRRPGSLVRPFRQQPRRVEAMDVKEAIYTRRSTRQFTDERVNERLIRDLIESAVQAPSAMNQQPWSFCVVRDKTVLAKISREAKAHMLRSSPIGLLSHHFEQTLNDPGFDIFYNAPVLILISSASDIPWAVEDCALAAENLMLAARAANLGTCWIGFSQAWLGTQEGKTALNLPLACKPVAPIIVGHPKSEPRPVPRTAPDIRWIGS